MRPAASPDEIWEVVRANQPELVEAFESPVALAEAVIRVVVATMATCVRDLTVRRGRDPKDYALVAYGGAGALHAVEIAQELGIGQVVVPAFPGLLCAYGALVADYALDGVVTARTSLTKFDQGAIEAAIAPEVERLASELRTYEGLEPRTRVLYECQFDRQSHSLHVEAPLGVSADGLRAAFIDEYQRHYGDLLPSSEVMLRSARIETRCARRGADTWTLHDAVSPSELSPPADARYWRPALSEGDIVEGPVTISAVDASIVLPAKSKARVVRAGHIIVEVES
jgi:N-methylhydantoinase A